MRPVGSVLERFRRAAAVPAAAGDTLEAELMPVFAALDEIDAEAEQIRAAARREAERRLAAARADAERIVERYRRRAAKVERARAEAERHASRGERGARDRGRRRGRGRALLRPAGVASSFLRTSPPPWARVRDGGSIRERRLDRRQRAGAAARLRAPGSAPNVRATWPRRARSVDALVALGRTPYRREINLELRPRRGTARGRGETLLTCACSPAGCRPARSAAARARGMVRARNIEDRLA